MIGTRYVLRFVMLIIFCTSMMFYTKLTGLLSLQLNVRSFDDQSILPSEYNLRGVESAGMIHRVIKDQSSPSSSLSYQSQSSWSRDHAREEPIRVLVYNRVPKTGSTTIANLFYESAPANGVSVLIANFSKVAGMVSLQDQMKFVHNISTWTSIHPVIVHGHFPYLNFHRFGAGDSSVVHVSMVREPLDRLVSSYYFKRYGDTFHGDKRHSKYRDTTTFDECVSQNLSECSSDALWFQIPYFCGSSPFCSERGSMEALREAKRRIVEDYLLVGVTERLEQFVQLLEALVPKQLSGVSNCYRNSGQKKLRRTKHKEQLQQNTINHLKNSTVYTMESEFYQFVSTLFSRHFSRFRDREKGTTQTGKPRENDYTFKYEKIRLRHPDTRKLRNTLS